MNKRLTIQQGTFLVAGNISQSLECNLIKLLEERKKIDEKENAGYSPKENFVRLNIRVNTETRMEILHRLRDMNITKATLFPDLSGLAESLNTPPESILSI
jgi:hypothetical protein